MRMSVGARRPREQAGQCCTNKNKAMDHCPALNAAPTRRRTFQREWGGMEAASLAWSSFAAPPRCADYFAGREAGLMSNPVLARSCSETSGNKSSLVKARRSGPTPSK
jgi:hypothetical protein